MSSASGQQIGGGTIRLIIQWVDWSGNNTDPDTGTQTLTIYNSRGALQATAAASQLTRDGTGVYHYDYVTPTLTANDLFLAQWYASISGEPDRPRYYFTVEA